MTKAQYRRFYDLNQNEVDIDTCGGVLLTIRRRGVSTVFDRDKARELAAILTHFAETGELPEEGTGDE